MNAEFIVMPRTLICSHFCNDLLSASFGLYKDRESHLLIDDGFYLDLTGDPIYETK